MLDQVSNRLHKQNKAFLDEDFLLQSEFAQILYHDYAKTYPSSIIIVTYPQRTSLKIDSLTIYQRFG